MQGHKNWVLCVAWSPDGQILATGGMDGALWLWDPKRGNPLGCCKGVCFFFPLPSTPNVPHAGGPLESPLGPVSGITKSGLG